MTQTVSDLAEFLLARITEDEAAVGEDSELQPHRANCRAVWSDWFDPCNCGYPARVLAECEAKRQIVQAYRDAWEGAKLAARAGRNDEAQAIRYGRVGLEVAMKTLALAYADHPDYDEAWRP